MFKFIKQRFKKQGLKMLLDLTINILTDIRNNVIQSEQEQKQQANFNQTQDIKNHL